MEEQLLDLLLRVGMSEKNITIRESRDVGRRVLVYQRADETCHVVYHPFDGWKCSSFYPYPQEPDWAIGGVTNEEELNGLVRVSLAGELLRRHKLHLLHEHLCQ